MQFLRKIVALALVLAFANYGVTATVVHSHEHQGFHQVHVELDGGHGRHHDATDHEHEEIDPDTGLPAPDHSETGFHSHSTPQFGPTDATVSLDFALETDRIKPLGPAALTQRHREKPPFKPPRLIL